MLQLLYPAYCTVSVSVEISHLVQLRLIYLSFVVPKLSNRWTHAGCPCRFPCAPGHCLGACGHLSWHCFCTPGCLGAPGQWLGALGHLSRVILFINLVPLVIMVFAFVAPGLSGCPWSLAWCPWHCLAAPGNCLSAPDHYLCAPWFVWVSLVICFHGHLSGCPWSFVWVPPVIGAVPLVFKAPSPWLMSSLYPLQQCTNM